MPRELAPLALQNKQVIYSLLFRASAATLLEVARDPRHLGAEIGFFEPLRYAPSNLAGFLRPIRDVRRTPRKSGNTTEQLE
jgi:hypothetical protein